VYPALQEQFSSDLPAVSGNALCSGQGVHCVCLLPLLKVSAPHTWHTELRAGLNCPGGHGRHMPVASWYDIWKPALHAQLVIDDDAAGDEASLVQAVQPVAAEAAEAYVSVGQASHVRAELGPAATSPAAHGVHARAAGGEPPWPAMHAQEVIPAEPAGALEAGGHAVHCVGGSAGYESAGQGTQSRVPCASKCAPGYNVLYMPGLHVSHVTVVLTPSKSS
jgi:hypothetical protein